MVIAMEVGAMDTVTEIRMKAMDTATTRDTDIVTEEDMLMGERREDLAGARLWRAFSFTFWRTRSVLSVLSSAPS